MCGFLITTDPPPFTHRAMRGLQRRGPDGLGFYVDERVRIGHARLAIVGLDDRGIEPIENERYVLVFNGEIYNWQELRYALQFDSVPRDLPTDAHVLLELWTAEGKACLEDLHGFWAFAIYDKQSGQVTLCRDQMGIKPLYYTTGGLFKAASTIAALDHHGELDYEALSEYVRYQFTFGNKTFFRNVKKVLPGQIVTYELGAHIRDGGDAVFECCIYEDIWATKDVVSITQPWLDETRQLLRECVLESRSSDAGFTTFCSGGLDSGMVTRIAEPSHAWHCNYSDPECNETFYARETWSPLIVHNASEDLNLVDRLTELVEDFDELSIGSVILPLDELMQRVRMRGDKVVLTGTGGDELFGGYVRYQLAQGVCLHENYREMFGRMQAATSAEQAFEISHSKGSSSVYRFSQENRERGGSLAGEAHRKFYDAVGEHGTLGFDRRYFLPGLLNIDDKIAGRHGLESRPSLLHQRFVRRMMAVVPPVLPELKQVGKQLAKGIVPDSVIQRKDKMGFTTPIGTFVNRNASHIRETISNSPHREKYDLSKIKWSTDAGVGKFDRQVFGLLLLDRWLCRYA